MAKPRWFRFSLRTLFVLVTVVASWLGWQLNWIRQRREFLETEASADSLPGFVAAPWSLRLLGEKGYWMVSLREHDEYRLYPAETRPDKARRLFPEAKIYFELPDK